MTKSIERMFVFFLFSITLFSIATVEIVNAQNVTEVEVGIWLVNVEKVDLAASGFKLDFYLWFSFDPNQIDIEDVKEFEFINGAPSKYEITAEPEEGYLEYRVRGDFIKTFDFTHYPFENQDLSIQLEHKHFNSSQLIYFSENAQIDPEATVTGWNIVNFEPIIDEHSYGNESYSRFSSKLILERPVVSAFIKSVLPISVITTIALLAFFVSPTNFAQRIGLGVTTLLSATAFHLSLVNGIRPTGYLTFADRMMIGIYILFLYNLSVSVYLMRLVDKKKTEEAIAFNQKALKILPILIFVVIVVLIVTHLYF